MNINIVTIDKREQKVARLRDINICCKTENQRLNRKLLPLNNIIYKNNLTVVGTLQEIKLQIKEIEKQKKYAINEKKKIHKTISKNLTYIYLNEEAIERLNQMQEMEDDVKNFIKQNKNVKKQNKNKITDPLLSQIQNDLPPEILRYIQEFFTYSTLCELFECKNKPFQMINQLKPTKLREIINIIFHQDVNRYFEEEIKDVIEIKYNVFYFIRIIHGFLNRSSRSNKDEQIFLKHIFLCFREKYPRILYGIYKFLKFYK